MPIFFALFAVLREPLKHLPTGSKLYEAFCGDAIASGVACTKQTIRGLRFLGMDLSKAASEAKDGFTDALPYYLLIALVVLTGYLQFKQTQSRQTGQANPQMAMMGKIFPVMFAFISFSLPSGVVLYFLVSNAWQIGQQALIYGHLMPEDTTPTTGNGAVDTARKVVPPPRARDSKPPVAGDGADGKSDRTGKTPGKDPAPGGGTAQGPESFGRAQPSGSRPRPKRRRR